MRVVATITLLREHMLAYNIRDDDLLFTSTAGTALSRNNFRTKYWSPAVTAAKMDQKVTFHHLRAGKLRLHQRMVDGLGKIFVGNQGRTRLGVHTGPVYQGGKGRRENSA